MRALRKIREAVRQNGLYGLVAFVFLAFSTGPILAWSIQNAGNDRNTSYSTFMEKAESGAFAVIEVHPNRLVGDPDPETTNDELVTEIPSQALILDNLTSLPADLKIITDGQDGFFDALRASLYGTFAATTIGILLYVLVGNGGKTWYHGRSTTKFADVAGAHAPKRDLEEIVTMLGIKRQKSANGARHPRGVLMSGPPGTGKTMLARAVAGEANVAFFQVSGAAFDDKFVGVGASRIRKLFKQARKEARTQGGAVIFIDEFDALAKERSNDENRWHQQALNQLLTDMDGFDRSENVVVLAATNAPEALDPAVTRAGRFDRKVTVPLPDAEERAAILQVHAKGCSLKDDVNLDVIARGTTGFSGADLEYLINEAALLAARDDRFQISQDDLDAARDRAIMGAERGGAGLSDQDKKIIAYHEAGHALLGALTHGADELHKVTIIPRGNGAGGHASFLPERDDQLVSKHRIEARLVVLAGGRAAEEVVFGSQYITNGAANDFREATRLARNMVVEWSLGPSNDVLAYGGVQSVLAPDTASELDKRTGKIVNKAMQQARRQITVNREPLEALANALLTHDTLSGEEVRRIVASHTSESQGTDDVAEAS